MEENQMNMAVTPQEPDTKIYKGYNSEYEDVDALLNALVKTDNVPNDVFEKMKLRSVIRYYCPVCVIAGHILVNFQYEKQEGDRTVRIKDGMQSGAFLRIPCHVAGALPEDIVLQDEIGEEFTMGGANMKDLEALAQKGYTVLFPEGVDGDAVVDQYKDQMLAMVKEHAMQVLKEELGNPSKLKINGFEFNQNAPDDEYIPGATLCKQPVTIMEYEYEGNVFKANYMKDELRADYPVDNDSEAVQKGYHKKMGICVCGIVLMLILQFALIHSWIVTLIVLLGLGGYIFKLHRELSAIQGSASDQRGTQRAKYTAADFLAPLKK